ncbi:DUF5655 domain-containing protein [Leptospira levettii]|uniref:DUF5655 domain-containing protein n=1 Tax=Leptospira levettii TaxID=2023178 RepID=UPI000C29BCBF|nr:DUF5655 domain-containing protein [Leptospira levettii]PJZ87453.1 hypothetical protein CH368_16740 [Leptospira levettii]
MEKYVKYEEINLKNHSEINEKWIQNKIAEDPSIVGLGDVILKDFEKTQITGGRLDLLFYDQESNIRYETELQLGKTDETHIIRTIEYWDIERKRNPQYEHVAVIIAEDITSRFLNVISLFNGTIPLIAIQMKGIKVGDNFSLIFTKILDSIQYEIEEESNSQDLTDRIYWEKKSSKEQLSLCDDLLAMINSIVPGYELNFTKNYIGLSKDGIVRNFVYFIPKKQAVITHLKLKKSDEIDNILDQNGFDVLSYEKNFNYYRFRTKNNDLQDRKEALKTLFNKCQENYFS